MISRRTVLRRTVSAGAGAIAGASVLSRRAQAAEFNLKYGNDLPATHPINKRAAEACDAIRAATNGRVDIQIFPNSQLGGSTDMLSQVRSGALDMFTVGSPLANLIPVSAAIDSWQYGQRQASFTARRLMLALSIAGPRPAPGSPA